MAAKRRQQKLLGHGLRWQGADPTCAVVRRVEVERAYSALLTSYKDQKLMSESAIHLQHKRPAPAAKTRSSNGQTATDKAWNIDGTEGPAPGPDQAQQSEASEHSAATVSSPSARQPKRICRQPEKVRDCLASFQAARGRFVLERRRGVAVEAFGRREDGQWVLDPEEVLYLAERGNLAVTWDAEPGFGMPITRDSVGSQDSREAAEPGPSTSFTATSKAPPATNTLLKLHQRLLRDIGQHSNRNLPTFDSYSIYSNLRRSGLVVRRPPSETDDHIMPTPANFSASPHDGDCPPRSTLLPTWLATTPALPTRLPDEVDSARGETALQDLQQLADPSGSCGSLWKVSRAGHMDEMPLYVADPDTSIRTVWEQLGRSNEERTSALLGMASPSAGNPNYLEFAAPEKPQRQIRQPPAAPAVSQPAPDPPPKSKKVVDASAQERPRPTREVEPTLAQSRIDGRSGAVAGPDLDLKALMESGPASFYKALRDRATGKG